MREHQFPPGVPNTNTRCIHCNGLWQPQMSATCIDRPDPPSAPRRLVSAMDDIDAIHSRIEELRKEREAAISAAVE